ncbi:L-threonylcarbamoyladenylate synthase [Entomospira culicis]|uniref:Threonylcarbamoyl-AMP synthase n=1 Tax=Entomospira culicis TaxID=2719989 RepID=A0A968GHG1_9SPIO|nr:L-threonylcarbamoyladenylate synthase [Entomospira culicis]NIZ19967.1 threonylcarbamoyl-AMP synthase [Entomospira culicis]NIZ70168.1 threonylcarbamoyl-AMP synthase [Entomospira culicis]WDI38001.1 L-threonylcarbamoyladenylate synthase [Entomospira culicis]WDI39624.1 L-threonylcarbamoyladenylate synthase [Entomospira culicis]
MKTEILGEEQLDVVVDLLLRQEIVAIPTETVYGLAGDATSDEACKQIFRIKGRAMDNPLISHFAHRDQLANYDIALSPLAKSLLDAFSPGPITLILPHARGISGYAKANLSTIAVRIPAHPLAHRLLLAVDRPLVAPSANLSGRYSATSASMVYDQLSGLIPAILDGGSTALGLESTVVLVQADTVKILRFGTVTQADIADLLGDHRVEVAPTLRAQSSKYSPILSPGMKYAHYQPQKPLTLFRTIEDLFRIKDLSDVFIIFMEVGEDSAMLTSYPHTVIFSDATTYAQGLYATLAKADASSAREIFAYYDASLGDALCDRLRRASGEKIL